MEPLKLKPSSKKISAKSLRPQAQEEGVFITGKQLISIQSKTIRIEKMLGKENSILKKQLNKKRIQTEKQKRESKEEKFETKPDAKKEAKKGLSMPRIGFFEKVKNFIGKVLLAFVAIKLLPLLPQLLDFLPKLEGIVDFVSDLGIGFLNILGDVLAGAYELRDKTIGFIEQIGGEGAVDAFLKFEKAIEAVLTALIAIGGIMAIAGNNSGPGGKGGKDGLRKGVDKAGRKVSPATAKRYFQRFGRDKFIERFGTKNLELLPKKMQRTAVTKAARKGVTKVLGKGGAKTTLKGLKAMKATISPIVKRIPFVGALIDFALNVFVFKEPLGKAAFKAIGAGLGAWIGGVIGTLIPVPFVGTAIGTFVGGLGGDAVGGMIYDMIFGSKKDTDPGAGAKGKSKTASRRDARRSTGKVRRDYSFGSGAGGSTFAKFGTVEQKKMLDAIAFAEGTTGSYGTLYGGRVIPELAAGEMTIAEVLQMQKSKKYKGENVYGTGYDSNATGRYQFMSYVLEEEIGIQGVKPSEKFTPEMQDRLILNRISRMRGVTPQLLAQEGMSDKVIDMLAPEFASFPNLFGPDAQGRVGTNTSYYGQGGKSKEEIKKAYGDSTGEASAIQIADAQTKPVSLSDESGQRPEGAGDVASSGTDAGGMYTGPAGYDRIGAGAAYHVDTKFHKSLGMGGMISAMDELANAYAARGREIVFSGQGYARLKAYTSDLENDEKKALLNSAIDAHSHSTFMRAEGFLPFDYYIPNIGIRDLYHPSTEGAEILLPSFGGSKKVGALYGGYGRSADIYDSSGNHVAMTGHGDLRRSHVGTINGNETVIAMKNQTLLSPSASEALGPTLTAKIDSQSTPEGVKRVMAAASGVSERTTYEDTGAQTIIVNNQTSSQEGGGYGSRPKRTMTIAAASGGGNDYGEMLAAGQ